MRNTIKRLIICIFFLVSFAPTASATVQDLISNMRIHYTFDDANTTGATMKDSAGTAQDLTCTGTGDGSPGKIGESYSFDGDDWCEAADHNDLDVAGNLTLMAWANTTDDGTYRAIIVKVNEFGDNIQVNYDFRKRNVNDLEAWVGDGAVAHYIRSTTTIHDGLFHFYVMTYNKNGTQNLYVDGVLNKTADIGVIAVSTTDQPLGIGQRVYGGSPQGVAWVGTIDEITLMDVVATATEVAEAYDCGVAGTTLLECGAEAPPTQPVISNINLTSNPNGSLTEPYNSTGDLTPTFTFTTDIAATSAISKTNDTFESCSTTGGTSHVCTLPFNNSLVCGSGQYVYVNATGTASGLSRYDEWEVWACSPQTGDTFEVVQYIAVDWFNNTHIRYNKTIKVINYYSINHEFDIPTMAGWTKVTGDDPIKVAAQASNTTVYQNISLRGISADAWYNQSAVTINGTNTNLLDMILPIDPPHAFMKDGVADCSLNPSIDQDTILAYTLRFINSGYFFINAILNVLGFELPSSGCEVVIDNNAGGELVIG